LIYSIVIILKEQTIVTAVTRENIDKLLKEQGSIIMKNTLVSKVRP